MGKMNKYAKTIVLGILGVVVGVGTSHAAKTHNIKATPHNLSTTAPVPMYASDEPEICIFCHTPHGGSLDGPLWNKSLPSATGYTHYSSATLASEVGLSNRDVSKESLLCLGCHDGSVSMYSVLNPSNVPNKGGLVGEPSPVGFGSDGKIAGGMGMGMGPGPKIGATRDNLNATNDLSDDHPISFSYTAVQKEDPTTTRLRNVVDIEIAGDRPKLYGADKRVECGTCHDPHVDYNALGPGIGDSAYSPFLIMPNDGSRLCLACHIK